MYCQFEIEPGVSNLTIPRHSNNYAIATAVLKCRKVLNKLNKKPISNAVTTYLAIVANGKCFM